VYIIRICWVTVVNYIEYSVENYYYFIVGKGDEKLESSFVIFSSNEVLCVRELGFAGK